MERILPRIVNDNKPPIAWHSNPNCVKLQTNISQILATDKQNPNTVIHFLDMCLGCGACRNSEKCNWHIVLCFTSFPLYLSSHVYKILKDLCQNVFVKLTNHKSCNYSNNSQQKYIPLPEIIFWLGSLPDNNYVSIYLDSYMSISRLLRVSYQLWTW